MASGIPPLLPSILKMKCPNCRKGDMFISKSIFPLGKLLDMPERCTVCGQKMELQIGFYYGTGYVSYGLSVGIIGACFVLYALTFGITFRDNSILYSLATAVGVVVVLQPWLMRMSRVLYLYAFVKYGKGSTLHNHNEND